MGSTPIAGTMLFKILTREEKVKTVKRRFNQLITVTYSYCRNVFSDDKTSEEKR